jgi:hypothetical protein
METREGGILNTDRQAADRFHQTELLERYIVGCTHSIGESSYGDAPRCQSSVRWEDIDLVHEFVAVLMRAVIKSTKSISSF